MTHQSDQDNDDAETTSFGFETVPIKDKQSLVNQVFSGVAERYDLMNDLMSGGLHRLWKRELIGWLAPPKGGPYQLLDVAGGTGDVAQRFLQAAGPQARAICCDISFDMLRAGRQKSSPTDHKARLAFVDGNAECLPFPDKSFDAYTIAFGIRNVPRLDKALREACRVLKHGGRFLCLEFSEVQVPILDDLYDVYSFNAIPALGAVAAGDAKPYRYLVESIRQFPNQDRFASIIEAAGFARVKYRNLSGGIAAIHSGWRI